MSTQDMTIVFLFGACCCLIICMCGNTAVPDDDDDDDIASIKESIEAINHRLKRINKVLDHQQEEIGRLHAGQPRWIGQARDDCQPSSKDATP